MKHMHHTQRHPTFPTLLAVALMLATPFQTRAGETILPLSGTWKFQLDTEHVGVREGWINRQLDDTIQLPGTTDTNRKGTLQNERPTNRLARVWSWKGPAWYQRDVTIPAEWQDKRITLFLERTKNSRLWVDGSCAGRGDSLSAPHEFDLTRLMKPGRHTITLLIDNSKLPPVGPAHAVDERTQTNWNGIIGRMELRATDPVWLDDVQIHPDAANRLVRVRAVIGNTTGKRASGKISVSCRSCNVCEEEDFAPSTVEVASMNEKTVTEFTYDPNGCVPLWSEFHPALLRMELKLDAEAGGRKFADRREVRFAMRSFTRDGNRLLLNGEPVFLRGRLDCANYPLTGHAPMDLASWRGILSIMREWGLNHLRFHSWCPPQAAFEAADEMGFYLQVELPNKRSAFHAPDSKEAAMHNIDFMEGENMDTTTSLYEYAKREGELIFRHFGNHPSFVMFTLGNELGRNPAMFELVSHFKRTDPRHLHAQGSNNMHWDPSLAEGDDFWVTAKVAPEKIIRGSFSLADSRLPHIEFRPPSTMTDYRASIEGVPVPLISHEIGCYQVFPDFREIPKFTGVLRARNYGIFRKRLEKAGMLDQADDFVRASGALSAICYREDIESALRTPDFGGFQLLDIMDFPGQGTAPVGMLNVFMEPKGFIKPEEWREFCCETVPLLRMERYTWTSDQTFTGTVEVAHHGLADIPAARLTVTVNGSRDANIADCTFPPMTLKRGGIAYIGKYELPLDGAGIRVPCRLDLTLSIEGTRYRNTYPIWVYPPEVNVTPPNGVMISRSFADAKTQAHLAAGGKVLLLPEPDKLPHSVQGGFQTDYWSPMFAEAARKRGTALPPGTLGILCNPASPLLAAFPTEFHSNWQWWHLVKNSRPIAFDGAPHEFRPIVQVIDNFVRNHKLGLVAETKVGKGSMLVCAIDLPGQQDKPEARQLLHSLLLYMDSTEFAPVHGLDATLLDELLP